MDLAFFDSERLKKSNKERYLLVIIDCFSKKVWLKPLVSKHCNGVIEELKKIFSNTSKPKKIQSDQGTEFKCKKMSTFLEKEGVFQYFSSSDRKASIVERVILSLKLILYKLMDKNKSDKWVKLIPDALKIYMNRYHRTIKMTPSQAELPQNQIMLQDLYREKFNKVKHKPPKFKIGQFVRIARQKDRNTRGWEPMFSEEIFEIKEVLTNLPTPRYVLRDPNDNGNPIHGNFFENELSLVVT